MRSVVGCRVVVRVGVRDATGRSHPLPPPRNEAVGVRSSSGRGGDFTSKPPAQQDKILATQSVSEFTSLLFEHTIEGLYASPEYGGNRGLAGWKEIGFPGDVQPRGYSADEVELSDGHDPVGHDNTDNTGIVADVLKLLGAL